METQLKRIEKIRFSDTPLLQGPTRQEVLPEGIVKANWFLHREFIRNKLYNMHQIMLDKYVKIMISDQISPHLEVLLKSLKPRGRVYSSNNNSSHLPSFKHPELNFLKLSEALLKEILQVHLLQRDVENRLYVKDLLSFLQFHSIPTESESQINNHKPQFR